MFLKRFAEICVLCLRSPPFDDGGGFTIEHVIPKSLGGILTSDFLCSKCNSGLGHEIEGRAKADPAIRMAVGNLRRELPDLYQSIEEGQPHLIQTAIGVQVGKYRGGEVRGRTVKLPDSVLASAEDTHRIIRGMLAAEGFNQEFIDETLKRFDEAPEEEPIDLSPRHWCIKRVSEHKGPSLVGPSLSPLVALKIAYEFAVLTVGAPVLKAQRQLEEIRDVLIKQEASSSAFRVEELIGKEYRPLHGIMFEGNCPHAVVQVRLFGRLAYRVHFHRLAFDIRPLGYTHDLATGQDCTNWIEAPCGANAGPSS